MSTSPTTTVRLPSELKKRVLRAAKCADVSPHNFILAAIAEKTELAEKRNDFHDEALKRYAKIVATGKTMSWEQMRAFLSKLTYERQADKSSKLKRGTRGARGHR